MTRARRRRADPAVAHELLCTALAGGHTARLRVRGRSMEPLLSEGDRVEVEPPATPGPGRVVLARTAAGDLICHRILARQGSRLWLAGDRHVAAELVPGDAVLGTVTRIERGGVWQRLDGPWSNRLDRLEAALHLLSARRRGRLASRGLEALRRGLLTLRARTGRPAPRPLAAAR